MKSIKMDVFHTETVMIMKKTNIKGGLKMISTDLYEDYLQVHIGMKRFNEITNNKDFEQRELTKEEKKILLEAIRDINMMLDGGLYKTSKGEIRITLLNDIPWYVQMYLFYQFALKGMYMSYLSKKKSWCGEPMISIYSMQDYFKSEYEEDENNE